MFHTLPPESQPNDEDKNRFHTLRASTSLTGNVSCVDPGGGGGGGQSRTSASTGPLDGHPGPAGSISFLLHLIQEEEE